jgi:hypothetical protein
MGHGWFSQEISSRQVNRRPVADTYLCKPPPWVLFPYLDLPGLAVAHLHSVGRT